MNSSWRRESQTSLLRQLVELRALREGIVTTILGPSREPRIRWTGYLLGFVVFVMSYRQSVWHQIYDGKLFDEGFISDLIWHNTAFTTQLIVPEEYIYSHLSVLLWIFGVISYLWPLDQISWFATLFALQPALTFVALVRLFSRYSNNFKHFFLIILAAFTLALGGGFVGALAFPHWEFWSIPFLLFALDFASNSRNKLSMICFILALTVKEDVATYISLFLVGLLWFSPVRKSAIKFGLLLSSVTFLYTLIRSTFLRSPSLFEQSYLGSPPFAHLNFDFFSDRLTALLQQQPHIVIPYVALVTAALILNVQPLKGIMLSCSIIPISSILAFSPTIGVFQLYYGHSIWLVFIFSILTISNSNNWKHYPESINPRPIGLIVTCFGLIFLGTSMFLTTVKESVSAFPDKISRNQLVTEIQGKLFEGWSTDTALAVLVNKKVTLNQVIIQTSQIKNCTLISNTAQQFSKKILEDARTAGMQVEKHDYFSVVAPEGKICIL